MPSQREFAVKSSDQMRTEVMRLLRNLLDRLHVGNGWEDGLLEALVTLNALPLTTHEFAVATNRLNNARRYLIANECGAARFELQLLLGSLKNGDDQRPIHRRFRKQGESQLFPHPSASGLSD